MKHLAVLIPKKDNNTSAGNKISGHSKCFAAGNMSGIDSIDR
jgi:hypothetical protein